jgi:hypothetical protein
VRRFKEVTLYDYDIMKKSERYKEKRRRNARTRSKRKRRMVNRRIKKKIKERTLKNDDMQQKKGSKTKTNEIYK